MKNRLVLLVLVAAMFAACQPEALRKTIPFDFFSQYEGPVKEVVHKVAASRKEAPKVVFIERFDTAGRLVSREFPAGGSMTVTYDTMDNAKSIFYTGTDTIVYNHKFGYDTLMRINTVISHNKDQGLMVYEYDYDANGYIKYSKTSTEEAGIEITYKRDKFGYLLSSEMNGEVKTEYYYSGKKLVRQMTYEVESGKRIGVQTFKEKLNDYGDVIERRTWDGNGLESIEYLEYTYY